MCPKSILHVLILALEQKPITLVFPCATFSLLVDCLAYEERTLKTHTVSRLQGWASAPRPHQSGPQGPAR